MPRTISWFSCGAASAVATKLAIANAGLAECYSLANIAKKFNVAPTTIHNIVYGISYTDVPFPKCEVTNERCQSN